MTSWREIRFYAPELAKDVGESFAVRKHVTMATIALDGSPRISGTEVEFHDDGEVYIGMMPGTRRADDLRRDARVAIHSPSHDAPEDKPTAWLGEAKLIGTAVEVSPDRFQVRIQRVVHTHLRDGKLVVSWWTHADGVQEVER